MTALVGVDAGGTKTTALVEKNGDVAGEATGRGAAIRPGRALTSVGPIAESVRRALAQAGDLRADAMVVGAAGAGRREERDELAGGLRLEDLAQRLRVTSDLEIALVAGFGPEAPGIVLVAGTGSAVVARDTAGATHVIGGYGWQVGDEGSGYALGRAALKVIGRAHDGRSPETSMSARVFQATRSATFDALIRWAATATPGAVASLAPVVLDCAAQGDEEARLLVDEAADQLVQLAQAILTKLPETAPVNLALHGGVLEPGRGLRERLEDRLRSDDRFAVIPDRIEPAKGALELARLLLPH